MQWHEGVRTGIRAPVLGGIVVILLGFGGFGTWAATAPLEAAVIAIGKVVAEGRNKVVQHLEGGIIQEILVEDGQTVEKGEPVIILDHTAAKADLERLEARRQILIAIEARSRAEREGAETVDFPNSLSAPEIEVDQRSEFTARRQKYRAELAILDQKVAALNEAIGGLKTQLEETRHQIELIAEERDVFEGLLAKGHTRKSQVLALKRAEADLKGREGQLTAAIAEAGQQVLEIGEQRERLRNARLEAASTQLSEARLELSDVQQRIRAARHVSDRVVIRAPADGTVINLTQYNPGAVVSSGQVLMEIVPSGTRLIIEARVQPQDIDELRVGQPARLVFSALPHDELPPLLAKVMHISADRLLDERTGEVFYLVTLRAAASAAFLETVAIGPGQPVEAFITTAERTFFSYIAEPFLQTMRRAGREA